MLTCETSEMLRMLRGPLGGCYLVAIGIHTLSQFFTLPSLSFPNQNTHMPIPNFESRKLVDIDICQGSLARFLFLDGKAAAWTLRSPFLRKGKHLASILKSFL